MRCVMCNTIKVIYGHIHVISLIQSLLQAMRQNIYSSRYIRCWLIFGIC